MKQNSQKYREDELMDLYSTRLEGDDPKVIQKRQKVMKKLRKSEYRRWSLKHLTENVGRGPKKVLKYIHVKNNQEKIVETVHQRQELERRIIQQNTNHQKKVF